MSCRRTLGAWWCALLLPGLAACSGTESLGALPDAGAAPDSVPRRQPSEPDGAAPVDPRPLADAPTSAAEEDGALPGGDGVSAPSDAPASRADDGPTDSSSDPDVEAEAEAEVGAEDTVGVEDVGEDKQIEGCPEGPDPDGPGCALACVEGWVARPDGRCHIPCPPALAEGPDGFCSQHTCAPGTTIVSFSPESEDAPYEPQTVLTCFPPCPEGLEHATAAKGLDQVCRVPCGAGWSYAEGGRCHRDCPEGMVPTPEPQPDSQAPGCTLPAAGAQTACASEAPFPEYSGLIPALHVLAGANSADADGSAEHPFATIGAALAASGDSVVLLLGAGTYQEHVLVEDKSFLALVGVCADAVHIVGEDLPMVAGATTGAIHVRGETDVRIEDLTVTSEHKGVFVECLDLGGSAYIEDVVVQGAQATGIGVVDGCQEITIRRATVQETTRIGIRARGVFGVGIWSEATALIEDCLVEGVEPCSDATLCGLTDAALGVYAIGAAEVTLRRNRLEGLETAYGLLTLDVPEVLVEANEVRGVKGPAMISVELPTAPGAAAVVRDNRLTDGFLAPWAGQPAVVTTGIEAVALGVGSVEVRGNVVRRIMGFGLHTNVVDGQQVVVDNDVEDVAAGAFVEGGADVVFDSNRIRDGNALLMTTGSLPSWTMVGNELADRRTDEVWIPESIVGSSLLEAGATPIQIGPQGGAGPYDIRANVFSGMSDELVEVAVGFSPIGLTEAVVFEGNAFYDNSGADLSILGVAAPTVRDNRFRRHDGPLAPPDDPHPLGLGLSGTHPGALAEVLVEANTFQFYPQGFPLSLIPIDTAAPQPTWTVRDNTFHDAQFPTIDGSVVSEESVYFQGNVLKFANPNLVALDELIFEDNVLLESTLLVLDQEEDSTTEVRGTLGLESSIGVIDCQGPVSLHHNELVRAFDYGLGVFSSPGPIQVERNVLLGGKGGWLYPGVGTIGDGLHISTAVGDPTSVVEVRSNWIEGQERLGILLSASEAHIEGNLYRDNGEACGQECHLVVQAPPAEDALTGIDSALAVAPAEPYGALSEDDF